ncbi:MAG: hypothetical protein IJS31_02995 [Oscillospiraceae bacterium]|nr:hypothetical protein [Oscillospiraceae bacterium]
MELTTINKKIEQTRAEINNLVSCVDDNMRAIMSLQLETRLAALIKEKEDMEAAAAKDTITMRIYGESVQKGKISSRTLLAALSGFQSMLDSIANAIVHSPTARGKIPDRVKSITAFEVVGTFAGSFGLVLEKPTEQPGFAATDTELNGILSEMFTVLESVDDDEQLTSVITPLGKRTVTHYREWLDGLQDSGVNLELDWKNNSANSRRMHLVKEKTPNIISTLDTIDKIDNEDITLVGILTGINIRSRSFEMIVDDYGLVKGHALPETLMGALGNMGKEISAKMVKSISFTKAGIQKTNWHLSSID